MKNTLMWLITLAMLLFTANVFAFDIPSRPDNGWYIKDTANKLSYNDIRTLNTKIDGFNKTTRNEIGILIVPTLSNANIENTAHDVFHSWGIGKAGLDNGILIMIAANDRKIRIETGKGAEGDIPDARVNQITNHMKPYFRSNDYAGALSYAIDDISKSMESRVGQKAIVSSSTPQSANDFDAGIVILIISMGGLGFLWWMLFRKKEKQWESSFPQKSYKIKDNYYPPPLPVISPVVPVIAAATIATPKKHTPHKKTPSGSNSGSSESSSSNSSSNSWDSGTSGSGGFDSGSSGGGFGGGDSGGGGGSDSW